MNLRLSLVLTVEGGGLIGDEWEAWLAVPELWTLCLARNGSV